MRGYVEKEFSSKNTFNASRDFERIKKGSILEYVWTVSLADIHPTKQHHS
jgi:hypothetical protein